MKFTHFYHKAVILYYASTANKVLRFGYMWTIMSAALERSNFRTLTG